MKVDLKAEIGTYTARRGRFDVVTVPPVQVLSVDGRGDPNTSAAYRDAVSTIFPLAYGLKFFSKRDLGRDYSVMPLEALWWSQDVASFTTKRDKAAWQWTLVNVVPDWVTSAHVAEVRDAVARKGGAPMLDAVRLDRFAEGLCVQTLHVGPYDDEGPVLEAMHHDVIPSRSLVMTGRHHEIYLSDARRSAPDRLRTILRQPVACG